MLIGFRCGHATVKQQLEQFEEKASEQRNCTDRVQTSIRKIARHFTPQNVMDAVRQAFSLNNATQAARNLGFGARNVQRWVQKLPGYAILADRNVQAAGARKGPSPKMDPVLEEAWLTFFKSERKLGAPTTHSWALRVMGELLGSKLDATEARLRGLRSRLKEFQHTHLSLRKVSILKSTETTPQLVLQKVEATLTDAICRRALLGLETKDSLTRVVLNDEMNFPFEVLVPSVYELVGSVFPLSLLLSSIKYVWSLQGSACMGSFQGLRPLDFHCHLLVYGNG